MAKRFGPVNISTRLLVSAGVLYAVVAIIAVTFVNYQTRQQALIEAEDKAQIILDRNLATHNYFTHQLKPKLFPLTDSTRSEDYFEPVWMSSGYAIREIEKYFHHLNADDYYYKQCAVNARNPENEADAYEKAFIDELNKDPGLVIRSDVRILAGKPYFVVMRRGERIGESCLRCHSTPQKAPGGLVSHYGNERAFHRKVGEFPSAISIRIPVTAAYAEANRFSLKLSILLLLVLGAIFGTQYWLNKRLILTPLAVVREKALEISTSSPHLAEKIPLPSGKELRELTSAFNAMLVGLRQSTDRLRQSEEKYRVLAEESPVSIMAFDGEGRVTFVNNWHLRNIAKSKCGPEFYVGKKITEVPGLLRAGVAPELERLLSGESVTLQDVYFPQFTGGHSGYQNVKGVPIFKEGEFIGGILLREDVTARKRAEDELRKHRDHLEELVKQRTAELEEKTMELEQANIGLQEADRLKSIFLASMSHELRTPLNSIIGFTGIILQGMVGEISDEQRKQLFMVKHSASHLLDLINDLLDISKIEAGKVELSPEEFRLDEVVREVIESFSPAVSEKGLELVTDMQKGITVFSDRRRVKQVLMNIMSNAVKFTDRGMVRIESRVLGTVLEVRFNDTGIGIKEEDMNKLFQPFQQIDMSLTKKYEGTGLGLHLTKKLLTFLGGGISAKSEYGKGSEFMVRIPVRIDDCRLGIVD